MEIRREIAAAITTGAGPGHVVGMPPRAVQRGGGDGGEGGGGQRGAVVR
jgi:hypothetical protein